MAGLSIDAASPLFLGPRAPQAELTRAERVVLEVLLTGAHNRQIADELSLSEATIRTHLTHIYSKFGVDGRAALLANARDRGLAPTLGAGHAARLKRAPARQNIGLALMVILILAIALAADVWFSAAGPWGPAYSRHLGAPGEVERILASPGPVLP